jgi:hypothetical protein
MVGVLLILSPFSPFGELPLASFNFFHVEDVT